MNEQINDGGPAFPVQYIYADDNRVNSKGMSVRDYFAASVMQGIHANPDARFTSSVERAEWAYRNADAMLAERAKRQGGGK